METSLTPQARLWDRAGFLLVLVNAALVAVFIYLMLARSYGNFPDGDEAMTFWGLTGEGVKEYAVWPVYMTVVAYVVFHYLGITTAWGFQMLGSAMAAAGAIGMNWLILSRLRLSNDTRLIVLSAFNLLLVSNLDLQRWGAFAVLLYPMSIMTGFVFVYILSRYHSSESPPRFFSVLILSSLLAVVTFAHPVLAIPGCAVSASLGVSYVLRGRTLLALRYWFVTTFMFFIVPASVGGLVLVLSPHPEQFAPRDSIGPFYFFLNDSYPKTAYGLVTFVVDGLKNLMDSVCAPLRLFDWAHTHPWFSWIPIGLLILGLYGSLRRRGGIRFVVAWFLIFELVIRLAANLAGMFPFLSVQRYSLSMIFAQTLMISLGGADLAVGIAQIGTAGREGGARIVRGFGLACAAAVVTLGMTAGAKAGEKITKQTLQLLRDQTSIKAECGRLAGATVIVDATTHATIHYYVGEGFDTNNRVIEIPKMFMGRGISGELFAEIKAQLAILDSIYIFTQAPFDEKGFREVYRAVDERFEEVSYSNSAFSSFARWAVGTKEPLFPNSDFASGTLDHWHASGFARMFALEENPTYTSHGPGVLRVPQLLRESAVYGRRDATMRYQVNTLSVNRSGDQSAEIYRPNGSKGELASDVFTIKKPIIGFRMAGQGPPQRVQVILRIENGSALAAAPTSRKPVNVHWDVSGSFGKRAQIIIQDADPAQENGIQVSSFHYGH